MPHHSHQNDHRPQVNLASQKPDRGRSRATSAPLLSAAVAQPDSVVESKIGRTSPGLPRVVGRIKTAPAGRTSLLTNNTGQIPVTRQQDLIEPRILEQLLVQ